MRCCGQCGASGTSSFVSAFFDEFSRAGLVIGFLEHDLWKSGVAYSGATVSAIVGVNGLGVTRDTQPHGMVSTTETPWLSLGVHPDWRDGLEAYADMQVIWASKLIVLCPCCDQLD